jgi:hypothetical protein
VITWVKRIFTDVFSSYLGHGGGGGFDTSIGMMFRLPLRDESMARYSELSNQTVTCETIDRLFARFQPGMFNCPACPLFLNSFRSIQLKETDERIGKFVRLNVVVTTLSPQNQEEHDYFVRCLRS